MILICVAPLSHTKLSFIEALHSSHSLEFRVPQTHLVIKIWFAPDISSYLQDIGCKGFLGVEGCKIWQFRVGPALRLER